MRKMDFRSGENEVALAKPGLQALGDAHAAVGLEVVFQQRGEHARHGEAGAVDRVHELGLARLLVAETNLRATRLERLEVRAARDF